MPEGPKPQEKSQEQAVAGEYVNDLIDRASNSAGDAMEEEEEEEY